MARTPVARRGVSLIETMVVVSIVGIMASFGVPRFEQAIEQSRANIAAANLRAIWSGQRAYWLQTVDSNGNNAFAASLSTLLSQDPPLIDQSLVPESGGPAPSYTYQVTRAEGSSFTATAVRANSSASEGTLTIDQDGLVTGTIRMTTSSGPVTITPAFP